MYERILHWPTTLEGVAWGATTLAVLHVLCPTLDLTSPENLLALIPAIRGAIATGTGTTAKTESVTTTQDPPTVTKETVTVTKVP